MEATVMTDYQYRSILKSIKMILAGCKDIKEAEEKIDELIADREKAEKEKEQE
ncbi:MAG: hypothetical protein IJ073_05360 [Lachnospiraceae bacterium]|nr:hypothetical protein [Lachnospiraceae bacterium]